MNIEKILTNSTILRHYSIKIDGQEMIPDEIISLEVKNDFFNFGISGVLKIKDSFDLNNSGIVLFNSSNKLTISIQDFLQDKSYRTYVITSVNYEPADERFKIIDIHFVDEISYILNNTYLSKGFNTTPIAAFKEYLTYLGIDDIVSSNKMIYDIEDTSTLQQFVVPQNTSVFEYFSWLFMQDNIRIWQDRATLHIKEVKPASLIPQNDANGNQIIYTNNTLNNEYIFKIHDFTEETNPTLLVNAINPISRVFRYNGEKKIIDTTINLNDMVSDLTLNTMDVSGLQRTVGEKYSTQSIFTTGQQAHDLFSVYMRNNQVHIVIPGSVKYSNIGYVANVQFKGNPMYPKTQLEGDRLSSGKYFISAVSDRYIGDKLIQKLTLNRIDGQKPRA